MDRNRKIFKLPPDIREKLDEKLRANNFTQVEKLAEWLQSEGFNISYGAVWRHGNEMRQREEKMRQAAEYSAALIERLGGDIHTLGLASQAIINQSILDFMLDNKLEDLDLDDEAKAKLMVHIMNASPKLAQATVQQEKRHSELKALDALEKEASERQDSGLDAETLRIVRERIYGF